MPLSTNVDAAINVLDFVRQSDHAGLLHLSTCYVAGARDGRVFETARPDYTPIGAADFDAEREWKALHRLVEETERRAEGPEVTEELRRQAHGERARGQRPARRGAGESGSQEPCALAAQ